MRKTLRETMLENYAALCQIADLHGKPRPPLPASLPPEPKRREHKERAADAPKLEGFVQAEIISYLVRHEKVELVIRFNSGAMSYLGRDNKPIPIWFHRIHRKGIHNLRVCDIQATLKNGRTLIVEAKREDWKFNPNNDKEVGQKKYINLHISLGNFGLFATSVQDVATYLEGI